MEKRVIGIDVGGTNLRGALVDQNGEISRREKIPSEAHVGIEEVVKNLLSLIKRLSEGESPAGVGFGIPAILDSKNGVITQAPNIYKAENYPIREVLERELGQKTRIVIENDANCAAVGEWWLGAGRDVDSLVMLTLGTGVGSGIILGGRLWRGAYGMGGEIGHTTIYPDGAKCNCGNYGCLEIYASASGIRRMVREVLQDSRANTVLREDIKGVDPDSIPEVVSKAALAGDEASLRIWDEFGKALGIGIANVVNILNVEMIVIGGGVSQGWDMFIDRARSELKKRALKAPAERVRITRSVLGDDGGIMGAAWLVLNTEHRDRG